MSCGATCLGLSLGMCRWRTSSCASPGMCRRRPSSCASPKLGLWTQEVPRPASRRVRGGPVRDDPGEAPAADRPTEYLGPNHLPDRISFLVCPLARARMKRSTTCHLILSPVLRHFHSAHILLIGLRDASLVASLEVPQVPPQRAKLLCFPFFFLFPTCICFIVFEDSLCLCLKVGSTMSGFQSKLRKCYPLASLR